MSDPFASAWRKIARATTHIDVIEKAVIDFSSGGGLIRFSEPDPKNPTYTLHKVRMKNPVPDGLSEIAGDALSNLRQALDHAVFALAIASGKQDSKSAYFPFGKSAADLENKIKGNCKDVPPEFYPLFRSFEPYKGGNEILYILGQMANRDKHAILTRVGRAVSGTGVDLVGTGFISIPDPHRWDYEKNEMLLTTLGPGAELKGHISFAATIAFDGMPNIEGMPCPAVLDAMSNEVERVVKEIEDKARSICLVS